MTTRLWDRAAVAVVSEGRRFPAVVSLGPGDPTVQELFDYMRDAELRFATLRMRIVERVVSTRGDDATQIEVMLRHPGDAKVTTSRPGEEVGGPYEVWISDGEIVRTYVAKHKLGTQRPIRNRPRGLDDPDFPGMARVYEPVTALPFETLPDTFVHPGGYCQNVARDGELHGHRQLRRRRSRVHPLRCEHPRTVELPGDRPDFTRSRSRSTARPA